jgi:hypothetical protein
MKIIRQVLLSFVLMAALTFSRAAGTDVEIHCTPKKVDATAPQNSNGGSMTSSKEHWNYEITVENKTFKPLAGFDVR